MKKTLFVLIVSLFLSVNQLFSLTIVSGTWHRDNADKVSLFKVENGKLKEIATSMLTPDKEFSFALHQKEPAFYVLGISPQGPFNNYTFYLNPDDQLLGIAVDPEMSYTLIGEATPQNKEMERWRNFILPLETKSIYFMKQQSNFEDYFPLLESMVADINNYTPEYTDDKVFNTAFEKYRKYNLLTNVMHFLRTPRSIHPNSEDFTDFFSSISLSEITSDPAILDYPYGLQLIDNVRYFAIRDKVEKTPPADIGKLFTPMVAMERDLSQLVDPIVKGEVILNATATLKTFAAISEFSDEFSKHLATDNQKERMHQLLISKADVAEGEDAFDFKFKDVKGKEVALSDFEGKLVYIDVWATWCGPCIKQIPSLRKLQDEYKDKNIVFMGVSIDAEKDHEKWKQFLKDEELTGVQLFAGDRADAISKPYKVSSIPRFILIGKNGKVLSSNAPRPSSEEISLFLDAALKK